MTKDDLLAAGYITFPYNKEFCPIGYQRVVLDKEGNKLYFINAYIWNFSELERYPRGDRPPAFEVRFYLQKHHPAHNSTGFTVELATEKASGLAEVEQFFAQIYQAMDCVPDLHNN